MGKSFVIKGNHFRMVDETYNPLVFPEAFDSVIPHPQRLNLAERMERAVYLGLDEKNITAKFVADRQII